MNNTSSYQKSKFFTHSENEIKRSFYIDDEGDITPKRPLIAKPSKFSRGEVQPFQTDDSDCTPKKMPISPKNQNKLSKFSQKEQHIEKDSDIHFDSDEEIEALKNKHKQDKITFQHPPILKSNSSKQFQSKMNIKDHPYRHLVYSKNVESNDFLRFLQLVQSGVSYSNHSLRGPTEKFLKSRMVRLKETSKKNNKLLILDLDETLIHSCQARDFPQFTITIKDGLESVDLCFNVRPYCKEFLKQMSNYYTIHLFTASSELYANSIVTHLDPQRQYITDVLCRSNCFETKNGFFIKDLRIITNRHLKDIVIVDNLPHSFGLQLENGIPILEWLQDPKDEELKNIQPYLIQVSKQEDVRIYNREQLKLLSLIDFKL